MDIAKTGRPSLIDHILALELEMFLAVNGTTRAACQEQPETFKKIRGGIYECWSDEMLAAFESAWKEVVQEEIAKDPMFKKTWEDLEQFRAEYKKWADVGFLPR